jgi:hypothetical protein
MHVQDRLQNLELTPLQKRLVESTTNGKPVLVYRSQAQHGYGCSILSAYLNTFKRWYQHIPGMPLKHLGDALTNSEYQGVVIDMPCAMQFQTAKRNNILRMVETSLKPVLVMCHGKPPSWLDGTKWGIIDITNESAPYAWQ